MPPNKELQLTPGGGVRRPWPAAVGSPPTNKRVEFDEIVILEFRNGKVVRQRGIPDNVTALRQLGVLPTPAS